MMQYSSGIMCWDSRSMYEVVFFRARGWFKEGIEHEPGRRDRSKSETGNDMRKGGREGRKKTHLNKISAELVGKNDKRMRWECPKRGKTIYL